MRSPPTRRRLNERRPDMEPDASVTGSCWSSIPIWQRRPPPERPRAGRPADAAAPGPRSTRKRPPTQGTRRARRAETAGPRTSRAEGPEAEPGRRARPAPRRATPARFQPGELRTSRPRWRRASATMAPTAGAKTAPSRPKICSSRPAQEKRSGGKPPRPAIQIQVNRASRGQWAANRWLAIQAA